MRVKEGCQLHIYLHIFTVCLFHYYGTCHVASQPRRRGAGPLPIKASHQKGTVFGDCRQYGEKAVPAWIIMWISSRQYVALKKDTIHTGRNPQLRYILSKQDSFCTYNMIVRCLNHGDIIIQRFLSFTDFSYIPVTFCLKISKFQII